MLYEVTRYSNGESSSNVYDEFGRLKYVYSADISVGADDTKKTEYKYDIKGRRESIIYPNGAKSTYEYYDDNNVKTLTNYIKNGEEYKEKLNMHTKGRLERDFLNIVVIVELTMQNLHL